MSLEEQETYLVRRLQELHQMEDETKKMLGAIRSGYKYEPLEERPDLEYDIKPNTNDNN